MSKNSFLKVNNLKEASINSFKIFLLSFPLSFSVISPIYIFKIEKFDAFTLLKIGSITGVRAVFLYLVILLAISLVKENSKKINVEKL